MTFDKCPLLAAVVLCQVAHAQLQWDRQQLDFKPTLQDTNVVARFAFENAGTNSIVISSIKTSCGCTTAVPDKKTYLPGEKGEIVANFIFGDRMGFQEKTILVRTDAHQNPHTVLKMRVFITLLARFSSRFTAIIAFKEIRSLLMENGASKTATIGIKA